MGDIFESAVWFERGKVVRLAWMEEADSPAGYVSKNGRTCLVK